MFGGFKGGFRTNEILIYDFIEEEWTSNFSLVDLSNYS